jgi:hypothetical protein
MPVLETIDRIRVTTYRADPDATLPTCTPADPFGIDNACPFNPTGHDFIAACGDVVCCHCSKVVWS